MRPRLGRFGPWRLWHSRVGSGIAAGLARLGVEVATTVCFEAAPADTAEPPSAPEAFSLSTWVGSDATRPADGPDDLDPQDVLVGATLGGELVGYCVLSDRPVRVEAIGTAVDADGLTLWDLYVEPAYRGRGLGAALLRHARTVPAAERAGGIAALVATDNRPSRRAFRAAGFRPVERLVTVGWGEHRYRQRTPLDGAVRAQGPRPNGTD